MKNLLFLNLFTINSFNTKSYQGKNTSGALVYKLLISNEELLTLESFSKKEAEALALEKAITILPDYSMNKSEKMNKLKKN